MAETVFYASTSEPDGPMGPSDPDRLDPASPQQETDTSVAVLERTESEEDDGDGDRFAHYVRKDKIARSQATGRPVVALCGKVWTPRRDASKYPVCPACKEIYQQLTGGN